MSRATPEHLAGRVVLFKSGSVTTMCALTAVAMPAAIDDPADAFPAGDPVERLYFSHTTPAGIRLFAVAEPVHRTMHGYLTAAAALAAFEEALAVAVNWGIEPGLMRAFVAANEAVRAANQLTVVQQRAFAGITALVIDGQAAVVGMVPPGQALLIQDRLMYGIPDLRTWSPTFMPQGTGDGQDPLGLRATVRPVFRSTTVRDGDGLLLGASAVGRVLARREYVSLADAPDTAIVEHVEAALEAARIDDVYAAWIPIGADPEGTTRKNQRQQDIERLWKGDATQPGMPMPASVSDIEQPPATGLHRVHARLVKASGHVLGGRKPHPADTPVVRELAGGANLRELRATRRRRSTPSLYAWLPRGMRPALSRREVVALLLVLVIVATAFTGRGLHFARAEKPDRFLSAANAELSLATRAASDQDKRIHLLAAEQSINDAINSGAKPDAIAPLQNRLATAKDALNGIERLAGAAMVAPIPASAGANPRLLMANGVLYLIAASVYRVNPNGGDPVPVLSPGRQLDGLPVEPIVNATVDGGALLVSDGIRLYRLQDDGGWAVATLPDRTGGGWQGKSAGAFKGNYYLLDPEQAQIIKFAGSRLDGAPTDWFKQPESTLAQAIDMEIDGHVYVLLADGTIEDYFKGDKQRKVTLAGEGHTGSFIGLAPSATAGALYVVKVEAGVATLIRVTIETGATDAFAAPTSWHANYDPAAANAFGHAVDFVVDDATHTLYFVTSSAIWKATLPSA